MPVPLDDILCRFIRPSDWGKRDNRPRPGAFKQASLSVWHKDSLEEQRVALEDLLIEHLTGYGQAHHAAGDYISLAGEAAGLEGIPFQVRVEWRPGDEHVAEPWRRWRYAHVQVETIIGPDNFLIEFRRQLALNCREVVAPG